jgi:hypothetical protein
MIFRIDQWPTNGQQVVLGRLHETCDEVGRGVVHGRGDMAVGVQGEHHRGMPEPIGHDFGGDPGG